MFYYKPFILIINKIYKQINKKLSKQYLKIFIAEIYPFYFYFLKHLKHGILIIIVSKKAGKYPKIQYVISESKKILVISLLYYFPLSLLNITHNSANEI